MFNQVVIIGKVIKLEKDDKGDYYLMLGVERNYKDYNGSYTTDSIRCSLWKGLSDSVSDYYKEGQYLSVSGRLEEKEGYGNLVIIEKLAFMGRTTKNKE